MTEFAWMVEVREPGTGRPLWWNGSSYTPDPNGGIRFARRLDAERVVAALDLRDPSSRYLSIPARATEHGWG